MEGSEHGSKGEERRQWRSLDELERSPDFVRHLAAEFPALAAIGEGVDRRALLKAMGASLALAGLAGCSAEPDEDALAYVNAPEFVIPGEPRWYATAVTFAGYAQPVVGKTHVGRPVKLEGNAEHPFTGGATDPFLQAALLGLYDPGRSQAPRRLGRPGDWNALDAALFAETARLDAQQGTGLRLLTARTTSPTLRRQIKTLLERWPGARWHVFEPADESLRAAALARVFGRPLDMRLRLDAAHVVVSFDDDLLGAGPRQSVHARGWSQRRRAAQEEDGSCRLFVAEPAPGATGSMAELRLPAGAARIDGLLRALAARLGVPHQETAGKPTLSAEETSWVEAAAAALHDHSGKALVSVGAYQPVETQALGLLINERLGAFGTTLRFTEPVAPQPDGEGSLGALVRDMQAGEVSHLLMLGVNPAYGAPSDLAFVAALDNVGFRLHAGLHFDETAALCHWHAPLAHELESWSDARTLDGTAGIIQPLVRPFYSVRSIHELVDAVTGSHRSGRDLVSEMWRETWRGTGSDTFEGRWTDALVRGFVAGSQAAEIVPQVADRTVAPAGEVRDEGLTLVVRPDPTVWDGRFADIGWLQELPKPLSKVTWGNVVLISPALAGERGIATGDELRIAAEGREIVGPAWVMPGQEARTLVVTLGYGRRSGLAAGLGYDAFTLVTNEQPWHRAGVTLEKTGTRQVVASTQLHQAMDGFDFVRTVSRAGIPRKEAQSRATFYPARQWTSPSWGMSIDLDTCIGCNACVVACVAENNIPVVGKELVAQGREMHWLRIDHYFEGPPEAPKSHFQPVPCMHCEKAPCEMGCPVNAAVHSSDGLNLQVYNRCIGTRTCSSYCPYKVRRFNWFDFTADDPEPVRAMRNPDVTVRMRGVMEKCTYCVQRISEARIAADKEGRPIRDGEVVTACQQACPTRAIVFGDVTDPDSAVSRRKADPRDYSLLEEANTSPRTTYLARIEEGGADAEGADAEGAG